MRAAILKFIESWQVQVFMAAVLLIGAVAELQADFRELEDQTIHGGHALLGLAIWHMLQGIARALSALSAASKL